MLTKFSKFTVICLLIVLLSTSWVIACDLCALYSASTMHGHNPGSITVSANQQYTDYSLSKYNKQQSLRNTEYISGFSTTQFGFEYGLSKQLAMLLTAPLITTYSKKVKDYQSSSEYDTGLGDVSLGANYLFYDYQGMTEGKEDLNTRFSVTGAVKFPTGDSGSLVAEPADKSSLRHHTVTSVTGDRVLTFGTGSYDFILGLNNFTRYERYQIYTSLQYNLNNEGDHNYEFADSLIWSISPGYYLMIEHDYSLVAGLKLSFEHKSDDRQSGITQAGTAVSNWFIGPELKAVVAESLFMQLAADFRVSDEDQQVSIVPEHRVLASMGVRF